MPRKPRDPAWMPPAYDLADLDAVRTLGRGEADAATQKRALDWIVNVAAGTYDLSFRSDVDGGDRETAFAEGRRFVGMQIVKLVNLPPSVVAQMRKKNA